MTNARMRSGAKRHLFDGSTWLTLMTTSLGVGMGAIGRHTCLGEGPGTWPMRANEVEEAASFITD